MRRSLLALLLLCAPAAAQEFKMEPPKSPRDSLACIKARLGFKVELMVAEPLVQSPIAFAWGPDAKFWVVEMGDYPLGLDGKGKPGGKIKYLEKSKPDGPYDKMTVFMDGLGFPTGVFPYDKGVLVTCAPDIFYAEVGKDGKAANKKILFTGFKEGNQQHRVNGLVWGIDNWIYGANGDSGGIVKSMKTGKEVNISGRDFRLKVETGEFEAVSGQSQFGRCRDDWGNWFGNNNSNPMYHYVLDDYYLRRNPYVLYPDVKVQVPVTPGAARVYPISKPLPRFNSPDALNHFTSACSTIIYRDNLFGKEFEGNMFVSEPVHNLVHREIVKPKGVTFTSQRADDEKESEFLASSDNWFRPTMIQVGPDGALWIADMYRYVIEHPQWIPKDWQQKLNLRAGHELGRIYRVYPADKKPREIPRLDKLTAKELVKQLESPSGWVRDTAHRMLVEKATAATGRQDLGGAAGDLAKKSTSPVARLHAMYVHEADRGWGLPELRELASDAHPAIRKNCLALLREGFAIRFEESLLQLWAADVHPQVRQQLAYSLSERGMGDARLAKMLVRSAGEPYIFAAALSSLNKDNWETTFADVLAQKEIPGTLYAPLLRMAKAVGGPRDAAKLFARRLGSDKNAPLSQQLADAAELVELMEKEFSPARKILEDLAERDPEGTLARLRKAHETAVKITEDPKSPLAEKSMALPLLGHGLGDDRKDFKLLAGFLNPRTPDDLQSAVVRQLGRNSDPRSPLILIAPWKGYSPALRNQVLDTLFTRPLWTKMTLDAIKKKEIPAQEIDAVRRQRLLQHKDAQVRAAAAKIFDAASDPERGKVVDLYWVQLPEKTDVARGAKLFAKSCATCHKLGGVGNDVGPDLASVGDKSVQGLLTAILDPNRAVEPRFINYSATTKAGLTFSGIVQSETSTSITLVSADGKKQQLLRNEIDELASTGKSLMPDGLEKDLSPRDIADIIAFVRGNAAASKSK